MSVISVGGIRYVPGFEERQGGYASGLLADVYMKMAEIIIS
jgi:hypothetical protein